MGRPKNLLLRTYFEKINKTQVICKNEKCENKLLTIHGANLARHLKVVHPSVYKSYIQKKYGQVVKVKSDTIESATDDSVTESDIVKLCCVVNKKHIQMAFIELFTKYDTPIHLAENKPFNIIVNPIIGQLKIKLDEQKLIENIGQFSDNLQREISEELRGKLISLKVDGATRLCKSIVGINAQFIKSNKIVVKALAIKEFTQQHISGYLKALILDLLTEYDIQLEQVVTITTDNGAHRMKGANDSKDCLIHTIDEFCQESDLICMDSDLGIDGISNIECGENILQLCVIHVINFAGIKDKLDIFRTTVKILTTRLYPEMLKRGNYKMPILDNVLTWTSTYHMLERLMELKQFIETIKLGNASFAISNEVWAFAGLFLNLFQMLYKTLEKLQSENFLYSDLFVELTNITIQLENRANSDLRLRLIESINRQKLILFENDLFVTAIFLDPRVKVCLAADQCARAKNCILQLYARRSFLCENESETQIKDSPRTSPASSIVDDALEDYFKAFDQTSNQKIFKISHQIEHDILLYERQKRLGIKENIIEFWAKQQTVLAEIALLVLGIPCSRTSNDKLFSDLAYIQSDQRRKLNYDNLEHILLVKANADFNYD